MACPVLTWNGALSAPWTRSPCGVQNVPSGYSGGGSGVEMNTQQMMADCVILIGLPGSGKTTFYRERLAATHELISKDLWPNARQRDSRQRRQLDAALTAGRSVVIDNTNLTIRDRSAIIGAAQHHHSRVIGYFFDVTTRAAVARNAVRTGKDKVPNVAIFTVAKRLEPPTPDEGFDELYRVTINEDRSFQLSAISSQ